MVDVDHLRHVEVVRDYERVRGEERKSDVVVQVTDVVPRDAVGEEE